LNWRQLGSQAEKAGHFPFGNAALIQALIQIFNWTADRKHAFGAFAIVFTKNLNSTTFPSTFSVTAHIALASFRAKFRTILDLTKRMGAVNEEIVLVATDFLLFPAADFNFQRFCPAQS
jgi:hypothetical protein